MKSDPLAVIASDRRENVGVTLLDLPSKIHWETTDRTARGNQSHFRQVMISKSPTPGPLLPRLTRALPVLSPSMATIAIIARLPSLAARGKISFPD